MSTREQTRDSILSVNSPNILCELPTSFGKSKIALDLMKMRFPIDNVSSPRILIVIPRLVLISNWKDEFKKWGMEDYLPFTEFVTYVSFPKKAGKWDMIILDEVHHFSERCRDAFESFNVKYCTMLSATVGRDMKKELLLLFPDLYIQRVTTKQAIQDEVLPDPKVFLIPLTLDNKKISCEIIKNNSQKIELVIPYSQKFNYAKVKNRRIRILCTQQQYYNDLSAMIDWYSRKKNISSVFKNLFLRKSGERLKWLSEQKSDFVGYLLSHLQDQRTLTFCNGISQTEKLGKYCINYKNKTSTVNLAKFNEGKINHITACNMLDEGMNLVNCRVGVYAVLNSSERMIIQKLGRILRHQEPIVIIPYYKNTREEEIVNKMLEDYNPKLVNIITNLKDLKL